MKNAVIKLRISEDEKSQLHLFAENSGKTVSEIVRQAIGETMRGHVAGQGRRSDIASLRRSINLMIEAFRQKPIDTAELTKAASKVRQDALKVLA